jgi:hypothetical protein
MKPFQLGQHALTDLEEAVIYLAEDSEQAALRLVDDLEAGFRFLSQWRSPDTAAPTLLHHPPLLDGSGIPDRLLAPVKPPHHRRRPPRLTRRSLHPERTDLAIPQKTAKNPCQAPRSHFLRLNDMP